jgi:hypothetical protein
MTIGCAWWPLPSPEPLSRLLGSLQVRFGCDW